MAFDDLKAEIERLVHELEHRPEGWHELYLELHGKLNELRALGMPVPDDLARFEQELEAQFTAERQGRPPPARPR